MTPEERMKGIDDRLDLVTIMLQQIGERLDKASEKIEDNAVQIGELVQAQKRTDATLNAFIEHTERHALVLKDAILSLTRLFEEHISDGHGGQKGGE
jgi:archaellum component FlaC